MDLMGLLSLLSMLFSGGGFSGFMNRGQSQPQGNPQTAGDAVGASNSGGSGGMGGSGGRVWRPRQPLIQGAGGPGVMSGSQVPAHPMGGRNILDDNSTQGGLYAQQPEPLTDTHVNPAFNAAGGAAVAANNRTPMLDPQQSQWMPNNSRQMLNGRQGGLPQNDARAWLFS